MVNCAAKQEGLVLEAQEGHDLAPSDEVAEERRRRCICGDAGWQYHPCPTGGCADRPCGLGEHRIGVDIAVTGEQESARVAEKVANPGRLAQLCLELSEHRPVCGVITV